MRRLRERLDVGLGCGAAAALSLASCSIAPPPQPYGDGASRTEVLGPSLLPTDAARPQGPPMQGPPMQGPPRPASREWKRGQTVLHGYMGAAFYEFETSGGGSGELVDDDATFPTIGGGAQWKMGGESIDVGLEGLLSFGWQGNIAAFVSTGGGGTVAVDVDLLVFDMYGGPFASVFLGEGLRLYAGAGPLLQWAEYDQDGPTAATTDDGGGFGAGYYARAGLEFGFSPGSMGGIGVRWTDVTLDLGGGVGDLDLQGFQVCFTVTQGF